MNISKKQKIKKIIAGVVALLLVIIMVMGAIAPLFSYMF